MITECPHRVGGRPVWWRQRMSIGETVTVEELERDPYPIYARLRAEEPVSWVESVGLWLVTRWDDVRTVDLSPDLFTAETEPSTQPHVRQEPARLGGRLPQAHPHDHRAGVSGCCAAADGRLPDPADRGRAH
jgi:cytochrome P450